MTTMNDPSTMMQDAGSINVGNIADNNGTDSYNLAILNNKSRPFVCHICTRAFIRQEHLKRHIRSHTNEKPFLCIFCGRCFARRDLVLRHQQKLHDTLIGTSQHHDLLSQFHNDKNILEKIEATKHVIKIEGNKQPILPTPTNPMAKTQSQLKKAAKLAERQAKKLDKLQKRQAKLINKNNNNKSIAGTVRATSATSLAASELTDGSPMSQQSSNSEATTANIHVDSNVNRTNPSQRRQRHASFCATSAFTYKQQNEHPTEQQLQNDLELMSGIPHQVGFSTPQMSATDLVDKAHENGIENIPFLTLDTINDGKSTTNFKDIFFRNFDKQDKAYFNQESLIDTPKSPHSKQKQQHPVKHSHDENLAAFDSVPFLADFLTMSSSAGGVGGFFNNHDTANSNNNRNTHAHDPNFEVNAVTNLDYFQYDDNFLNLSRINTNSSVTSSLSSRNNSRRPSNVTPVVTAPNATQQKQKLKQQHQPNQHNHQDDDQYLNRNNHGLYYNGHNSHSVNGLNESGVGNNNVNTHDTHPPSNRVQSGPERVLSKFIANVPFETDFLNNVDTQHFNDIGFANIHDPSHPYQNNQFPASLSRQPSNAPTSLSQQSAYDARQNSYTHSNSSMVHNPAQELNSTLLSRNSSVPISEKQYPNQNISNNILINQGNSPANSNIVGHQTTRKGTADQLDSKHGNCGGKSINSETTTQQVDTEAVVIDQSHSNNKHVIESEDTHLTMNFSSPYTAHQKHTPAHSQTQTPLPPPSQIPSRSQSRTTSIPVPHIPVNHSKSHHSKPNQNDQYDLTNLFQSRQMDMYNKHLEISNFAKVLSTDNLHASFHENMAHTEKLVNDINFDHNKYRVTLFTDQYRGEIIRINGLKPDQFPTTEQLNKYVSLYQDEFHKFFPFIHLHSIIPTTENHPFVLSIAMIGALYSFHSIHSLLLSNIAWFQIKELLERQHNDYSITPLWAIQSIVLLTFIGIFSNDINVTKSMKIQLATLVELVRLTKLNQPLEHSVNPPIESDHSLLYMDDPRALQQLKERYHSKVQFEKDFQYFIKAQTRIRTCHVILIISNFFTSLTGIECIFHSIDLKCGLPCYKEILYQSPNSQVWSDNLKKFQIELDSKFSLIELSNGNGTYDNCLMYLSSGAEFYSLNSKISFKTLLSLLFSIHEKISIERSASLATPNGKSQHQLSKKDIFLRWKINSIPVISSMLKHWEILFLKSGGIFKPNHDNIETINAYPSLRLIIPLYHFVKVRENVQIAPMMRKIWKQDWNAMNHQMSKFYFDWETLREACTHSLHIIEFWIDTVSILEFDPEKITITTPVFSISCMVSSVLILSEYLRVMELTLQNSKNGNPNNTMASHLQISDKVLWIKIYHLLDHIEVHLKQKGVKLSGKTHSTTMDIDNLSMAEIRDMIRTSGLSKGILHIGVDILSACPVWSVGILFAQALQSRSLALEHM